MLNTVKHNVSLCTTMSNVKMNYVSTYKCTHKCTHTRIYAMYIIAQCSQGLLSPAVPRRNFVAPC